MSTLFGPETTFQRRSCSIFSSQRARAKKWGQRPEYTLPQFREFAQARLPGPCAYCGRLIDPLTFSVDHRIPVSRNGPHRLDNLLLCCPGCNEIKGSLTETEFRDLKALVSTWPPYAQVNLMARLRSGGKAMYRKR